MAQPKNKQIIKVEIKNFPTAGAVGAAYAELIGVQGDSKGVTWKGNTLTLGSNEKQNRGGTAELDILFTECAATLATEANLNTDIANGVRFLVKVTYIGNGTDTFGDTARGVLVSLDTEIKDGVKMFHLTATQDGLVKSNVISEA